MMRVGGWVSPERFGRPAHKGITMRAGRGLDAMAPHVRLRRPVEVYDQASVGSCVAQAVPFAVEIIATRMGLPADRPDRTALYRRAREAIGTAGEDSGCIIADAIEVVRVGWETERVPPSPVWDASYLAPAPPRAPDAPRVVNSEPLAHDLATVCWELLCGNPVVVGLRLTEQWERPGEVIGPPEGDVVGGHAVCLVGYQREGDQLQVRVRNSWGSAWGVDGEAWLDAAWLGLSHCGELHALRSIRRMPHAA